MRLDVPELVEGAYRIPAPVSLEKSKSDWVIYGPWICPTDAAKALGVRRETVRAWAHAGMIRFMNTYPGQPRLGHTYNADDVAELVKLTKGYPRPGLWLLRLTVLSGPQTLDM
jgi:hypothetical protein